MQDGFGQTYTHEKKATTKKPPPYTHGKKQQKRNPLHPLQIKNTETEKQKQKLNNSNKNLSWREWHKVFGGFRLGSKERGDECIRTLRVHFKEDWEVN